MSTYELPLTPSIVDPFNKLTPDEHERLAVLLEELGEATQIVGKILRFGYASVNPLVPRQRQVSNRVRLQRELGDVMCAISLLTDAGDLDAQRIAQSALHKAARIHQWLRHQTNPRDLEQIGELEISVAGSEAGAVIA